MLDGNKNDMLKNGVRIVVILKYMLYLYCCFQNKNVELCQ